MADITGLSIGPEGFGLSTGGGTSTRKAKKLARESYKTQAKYMPDVIRATADAYRSAGLHPAFTMGGTASAGAPVAVGGSEGGTGGHFSKKVISGPEAAAIRESNARTELLKAETDAVRQQARASAAALAGQNQGQTEKPVAESQFKGIKLPGGKVMQTGDSAGAQEWEDRYWEIGGAVGAMLNIGGDAVGMIPEETIDKWIDRTIRAKEHNRRMRQKAKQRNKKYKPGYSFSPYKSQRGNWK